MSLQRRERIALAALLLLLVPLAVVPMLRSGAIFARVMQVYRCRACGSLRKETGVSLLSGPIFSSTHRLETALSRIPYPSNAVPCTATEELPVSKTLRECTFATFPLGESAES